MKKYLGAWSFLTSGMESSKIGEVKVLTAFNEMQGKKHLGEMKQ